MRAWYSVNLQLRGIPPPVDLLLERAPNVTVCKRVLYSGRVQGVGFRYTAQGLARGFAIAGFVRNLANGNVELVAQGEELEVAGFLGILARRMADAIREATIQDEELGEYEGFQTRY
jgi:acylphosphatase